MCAVGSTLMALLWAHLLLLCAIIPARVHGFMSPVMKATTTTGPSASLSSQSTITTTTCSSTLADRRGFLRQAGLLPAVAGASIAILSSASTLSDSSCWRGAFVASADDGERVASGEPAAPSSVTYTGTDGKYSLTYPGDFTSFRKPLKTHFEEVNFKSEAVKGYQVGVVVDPVRLDSLEKFGTPEDVGNKVIKVEQSKDGTIDATLISSSAEVANGNTMYTFEYAVTSSHYVNHYIAKVAVKDGRLYVCTAQAKTKDFDKVEKSMRDMVQTFSVS